MRSGSGRESAMFCSVFREERMDKDFAELAETLKGGGHPMRRKRRTIKRQGNPGNSAEL